MVATGGQDEQPEVGTARNEGVREVSVSRTIGLHHFHADDQARPSNSADPGIPGRERPKPRVQRRAANGGVHDEVLLRDRVEDGNPGCAGDGIAAERRPVRPATPAIVQVPPGDQGCERQPVGDRLSYTDGIRQDAG